MKSGYIALLGPPNAGKSTLLNTILGEKLIAVSRKPQTTRQRFLGIYSNEQAQIIFVDLPGIHQDARLLNQYMMEQVQESIVGIDGICWLIAADQKLPADFLNWIQTHADKLPKQQWVVLTKQDLGIPQSLKQQVQSLFPKLPCIEVSAQQEQGISLLLEQLIEALPEGPAYYDPEQLTPANLRDIVAELIREAIMEELHQEIPYGCAVEIVEFKENQHPIWVSANIIVEQNSQKGMVIGKAGSKIKAIGSKARPQCKKLLGKAVHLDLKVKIDQNWTKNPQKLKRYGYGGKN